MGSNIVVAIWSKSARCCQPRCQNQFLDFCRPRNTPLKYLIYLAPRAGFEPATNRLTAGCSTAELPGNAADRVSRTAVRLQSVNLGRRRAPTSATWVVREANGVLA